ncbi:MAG: PIN domain-containing protein [Opitutaceae bacterium]
MIVTLTSKRQVTFPKRVVEQLRLRAGDSLVLTETPDGVLMRPRRFDDAQLAPLKGKIRKTSKPFAMPRKTQLYGIDTSVFVRLLTGDPELDFKKYKESIRRLLDREPSAEIVVSNQVLGEAYIALQHHYNISKNEARAAMLQLFDTGSLSPMNGNPVIQILKAQSGCGLVDRLIAQDYEQADTDVVTNDRKMAKLENVQLL